MGLFNPFVLALLAPGDPTNAEAPDDGSIPRPTIAAAKLHVSDMEISQPRMSGLAVGPYLLKKMSLTANVTIPRGGHRAGTSGLPC